MFFSLCKKWGRPPPSAKGGWTTRGIVDWNHATELLKQHSGSKWHHDSSITARMAKHVDQQNGIEMQCAGAAEQAEEQKKKNCEIILKMMRAIHFLAKNRIPHLTTYKELIELQVLNGDKLLKKHLNERPSNAQYISRFSARVLMKRSIFGSKESVCVVSTRVPTFPS